MSDPALQAAPGRAPEAPETAPGSLRATLAAAPHSLVRVLVINTLIGVFLHFALGGSIWLNEIYSHAIGLSIFTFAFVISCWSGFKRPSGWALLIAVPLGAITGVLLARWVTKTETFASGQEASRMLFTSVAMAVAIGGVASYYFYARSLLVEREAQLKEVELARALDRQRLIEAQLKMLQAQIEPHFLFNTLSNVLNLIDDEPATAKTMLEDLTRLLRRSLQRARADRIALADEFADIRAYLDIHSHRMGPRLRYTLAIEPGLEAVAIPPYLVQPLVENAIRHGLEPQVEGGEIAVRAARDGALLTIEVADGGRGLRADRPPGVALANIRDRLAAKYGSHAELTLHPNGPRGVIARLRLPLAGDAGASAGNPGTAPAPAQPSASTPA
ncbi:MAG TPA: histidine kinase [Burkholderiaceae bacterium]